MTQSFWGEEEQFIHCIRAPNERSCWVPELKTDFLGKVLIFQPRASSRYVSSYFFIYQNVRVSHDADGLLQYFSVPLRCKPVAFYDSYLRISKIQKYLQFRCTLKDKTFPHFIMALSSSLLTFFEVFIAKYLLQQLHGQFLKLALISK